MSRNALNVDHSINNNNKHTNRVVFFKSSIMGVACDTTFELWNLYSVLPQVIRVRFRVRARSRVKVRARVMVRATAKARVRNRLVIWGRVSD